MKAPQPGFKPHGSARIAVSDAILTVHIHDDWNIEMRDVTGQQMAQHVPALNAAGPWGVINHLHDTLVYCEEVFASSRAQYAARPATSRLAAVAFVIEPGVEGRALLMHRFQRLLSGVIDSAVFDQAQDARQWMLEKITMAKG